jgi:hypothetical protein
MNASFLRGAALTGALFLAVPPITAQTPDDSAAVPAQSFPPAPKSGTTATLLSAMLPGIGHVYAGEYRTGTVLIALFASGIALGASGENSTSGLTALLIGAGPWWYGVIDAHNAAARYNRAHFGNPSTVQVRPVLVKANRTLQIGIGVSVAH